MTTETVHSSQVQRIEEYAREQPLAFLGAAAAAGAVTRTLYKTWKWIRTRKEDSA